MGPRGEHSREEFRALLVAAAERIAREQGLRGLGMRPLAVAIGYAPNSIYNAVGGLDEIVLLVNARTLTRLRHHLAETSAAAGSAEARVLALARGYLAFVMADPRLWSLLFEHVLPPDGTYPDWYRDALNGPIALVDEALVPLAPEAVQRRRLVVALWASLHGLASLATSSKLAAVSRESPAVLAESLVGSVLDGLRGTQRPRASSHGDAPPPPHDLNSADAASGALESRSKKVSS